MRTKPIISAAFVLWLLCCSALTKHALAQLPFYTDDTGVTASGMWHVEFFNELDSLQHSQYPDRTQNTANFKLNRGLPYNLELDVDAPYLLILRDGTQDSNGGGDADMGIKWRFRNRSASSHLPALASSLYIEFPTGSVRKQLGSGLTDYALNFIAQEPLTERTRVTVNAGFLFAGNTSTGVVGIQTTRGNVFTGGISALHDFSPRLTLGAEITGGIADNSGLARDQLQALAGGSYALRKSLSLTFAMLGGKYTASPRIGGQFGFAWDLPSTHHPSP